jgi:phage-related tail protein
MISLINDFIGAANKIPGIKIPTIPNIPMFASGVRNFSGGKAIVGENGPELVDLPQGSSVYSNSESQKMVSGAGSGVTVVINGGVFLNNDTVNQLAQAVQKAVGRNNRVIANGGY